MAAVTQVIVAQNQDRLDNLNHRLDHRHKQAPTKHLRYQVAELEVARAQRSQPRRTTVSA